MKYSAGLIVYRPGAAGEVEVLLVHPGGPFWAKKDTHGWSIPKGEYEPGEDPAATAEREFAEEVGQAPPLGERIDLGSIRASGKTIQAYAVAGDLDASRILSNTFTLEWPRGSGQMQEFPEVDRAEWFSLTEARTKLHKGQVPLVDLLLAAFG